eukprot:2116252-Pleurochrysis_carterae.AAC.1
MNPRAAPQNSGSPTRQATSATASPAAGCSASAPGPPASSVALPAVPPHQLCASAPEATCQLT